MSSVYKTSGVTIPVTAEMLDEADAITRSLASAVRRITHPWEWPDRNPFPYIDPTPRLSAYVLRYRAWRQRITDAREVLRYGLDDTMCDRDGWTYDP